MGDGTGCGDTTISKVNVVYGVDSWVVLECVMATLSDSEMGGVGGCSRAMSFCDKCGDNAVVVVGGLPVISGIPTLRNGVPTLGSGDTVVINGGGGIIAHTLSSGETPGG